MAGSIARIKDAGAQGALLGLGEIHRTYPFWRLSPRWRLCSGSGNAVIAPVVEPCRFWTR
jgi:hypothetical protein